LNYPRLWLFPRAREPILGGSSRRCYNQLAATESYISVKAVILLRRRRIGWPATPENAWRASGPDLDSLRPQFVRTIRLGRPLVVHMRDVQQFARPQE
jgi:hypothetical protein